MSDSELNFDLLPRLPLGRLPVVEPAPDLWQRIAAAQRLRLQGNRMRRRGALAGGSVLAIVVALAIGLGSGERPAPRDAVDWQARAQALELQLRALTANRPLVAAAMLTGATQNELVLVDAALQAAYDDGGERDRVDALWKRRSELLGALLQANSKDIEVSRI